MMSCGEKMEKLSHVKAASCDKCGYTWLPRVKSPLKCPKCGHRFDSQKSPQRRHDSK